MTIQRDVHLLVLDTLSDWEVGYAIAYLNRPAPGMASSYRVRTVGLDRGPVRTIGGVTIMPELTVADVRAADSALMILPGSDLWGDPRTDPVLDKARELVQAGVPVAAICGATFGLARAGLLDDRRHTSNAPVYLTPSGYRGAAHYVDAPAVEDRDVITASGTAPVELAQLILARLRVFSPRALEAWFGLYKTGNPACYAAFVEALEHGGSA
jgi:putative intracellular protease/amidase